MVTYAHARRWPLVIASDAGLLFAKLAAFVVMVADHVDWFLLDGATGFHATWGRMVFPLFVFVLALNLARPGVAERAGALALRLLAWGVVSCVAYVPLAGVLPLNVLFTLAAGAAVVWCIHRGWWLVACSIWAAAGAMVDYYWFGVAALPLVWWLVRSGLGGVTVPVVLTVLLWPVNGSAWTLAAALLTATAYAIPGDAPRLKWLFWAGYPLHLAVLAIAKAYGV